MGPYEKANFLDWVVKHSYGDGIEQIPTTFQQLRETGSEAGRSSEHHFSP